MLESLKNNKKIEYLKSGYIHILRIKIILMNKVH